MKRKHAVVEIVADRIDLVVFSQGKAVGARRVPFKPGEDVAGWLKAIREAAEPLRTAVAELNAKGATARMIYQSATQTVELGSYTNTSENEALSAATLQAMESKASAGSGTIMRAAIAANRRVDGARRVQVITAIDREDVVRALVDLLEAVELDVGSITPLAVRSLAQQVARVMDPKSPRRCWLDIGTHESCLVIGGGGQLLFSRTIGLGTDSLAQALMRPVHSAEKAAIRLTPAQARKALFICGVVDRSAPVPDLPDVRFGQLLPSVQPLLQRFVVEVRQSLRFGVNEADRADLSMVISGPGALVPGFGGLLGDELEIEAKTELPAWSDSWERPGATIGDWSETADIAGVLDEVNLLPQALESSRRKQQFRRWLWAGAAAAVAMIGFDAFRMHVQVEDARKQASMIESRQTDAANLHETSERLAAIAADMDAVRATIDERLGQPVDFQALLLEMGEVCPEDVKLRSAGFSWSEDHLQATVTGYALPGADGESPRVALERFIHDLGSSPLIADVSLGYVTKSGVGDVEAQEFEAVFRVVPLPRETFVADASIESTTTDEGGR